MTVSPGWNITFRARLAHHLDFAKWPWGCDTIALDTDGDIAPAVTAVGNQSVRVLRNIIGNAVKHHDKSSGNIRIRAEDVGRYCELTVSDDGPGIAPASRERVFQMFQTLSAREHGHSGIGLALTKRLVEAHGGRISLDSTEGVRGATFHVWWPWIQWRKAHD